MIPLLPLPITPGRYSTGLLPYGLLFLLPPHPVPQPHPFPSTPMLPLPSPPDPLPPPSCNMSSSVILMVQYSLAPRTPISLGFLLPLLSFLIFHFLLILLLLPYVFSLTLPSLSYPLVFRFPTVPHLSIVLFPFLSFSFISTFFSVLAPHPQFLPYLSPL